MKRDMDLIRNLLLAVENSPDARLRWSPKLEGYTEEEIAEHFRLGFDAGLFDGTKFQPLSGPPQFASIALTWSGHEFLDTVRDPEIWEQTKAGAAKLGSLSLGMLAEIAAGYLKAKAASLGLPML